MDDNAATHPSRIVTAYLEEHGVERMNWPTKSPDMNPIKHAWACCRCLSVRPNKKSTIQELAEVGSYSPKCH